MSILINSETIYLFKDFNDANEEILVNWRLQPIDFFVLSIKKIFMHICSNAISSRKLWILGMRFKGQPSAQWLFMKLCRIDGIEKKKKSKVS